MSVGRCAKLNKKDFPSSPTKKTTAAIGLTLKFDSFPLDFYVHWISHNFVFLFSAFSIIVFLKRKPQTAFSLPQFHFLVFLLSEFTLMQEYAFFPEHTQYRYGTVFTPRRPSGD